MWVKLSNPGLKPSMNYHVKDPPARAHARTRPEHDVKLLDPCSHASPAQARSAIPWPSLWSFSSTSSSTTMILELIITSSPRCLRGYFAVLKKNSGSGTPPDLGAFLAKLHKSCTRHMTACPGRHRRQPGGLPRPCPWLAHQTEKFARARAG